MLTPVIIAFASILIVGFISTLILLLAVNREEDNITLYDHVKARQDQPTPTHIDVPRKEAGPVNKKIIIFPRIINPAGEGYSRAFEEHNLNMEIQGNYEEGWHLRYAKPMPDAYFLLFTHAEFDEEEYGNDD